MYTLFPQCCKEWSFPCSKGLLPYFSTYNLSIFSVFKAKVWLIFSQEMGSGLLPRVWDSKQTQLLPNNLALLRGDTTMMQK